MNIAEMERTKSSQTQQWPTFETLDASQIRSILTAHGWENVSDVEKKNFSVTSSEPTGFYTYLKYKNEDGQTCYTSFNNIISVSPEPHK